MYATMFTVLHFFLQEQYRPQTQRQEYESETFNSPNRHNKVCIFNLTDDNFAILTPLDCSFVLHRYIWLHLSLAFKFFDNVCICRSQEMIT